MKDNSLSVLTAQIRTIIEESGYEVTQFQLPEVNGFEERKTGLYYRFDIEFKTGGIPKDWEQPVNVVVEKSLGWVRQLPFYIIIMMLLATPIYCSYSALDQAHREAFFSALDDPYTPLLWPFGGGPTTQDLYWKLTAGREGPEESFDVKCLSLVNWGIAMVVYIALLIWTFCFAFPIKK